MKKILRKNSVILTVLAIMIAVAGYLNFTNLSGEKENTEASTDSYSILDEVSNMDYDITDANTSIEEETETPGTAILTESSAFAAQAKLSREQVRSQNKADLQAIIDNQELTEEQKQEAVSEMVNITELSEKESAAELLLEAKGFSNSIVNLTGETVDVVIPYQEIDDVQRAQIEDIVKRKTGAAPEQIVITPLSQSLEETEDAGEDTTEEEENTTVTETQEPDMETEQNEQEDQENQETWSEDMAADYDYTQEIALIP